VGNFSSGWRDCGRWSDANFWRWTPQAGEIPQEAVKLIRRVERPAVDYNTDQALTLIRESCSSLYVATESDKIVGALVISVSQSVTLGPVLEIEACSFKPRQAKERWEFIQALAKQNDCQKIRAISSRPLHKTFPDLQPCEAVFYSEVN